MPSNNAAKRYRRVGPAHAPPSAVGTTTSIETTAKSGKLNDVKLSTREPILLHLCILHHTQAHEKARGIVDAASFGSAAKGGAMYRVESP
jgi:hypothetical protein